jgi:hypothetical protein
MSAKQDHMDDAKVLCQLKKYLDPLGSQLQWSWDGGPEHGELNPAETTSQADYEYRCSLLKKCFKSLYIFTPLILQWVEYIQGIVPVSPVQNTWFLFSGAKCLPFLQF